MNKKNYQKLIDSIEGADIRIWDKNNKNIAWGTVMKDFMDETIKVCHWEEGVDEWEKGWYEIKLNPEDISVIEIAFSDDDCNE